MICSQTKLNAEISSPSKTEVLSQYILPVLNKLSYIVIGQIKLSFLNPVYESECLKPKNKFSSLKNNAINVYKFVSYYQNVNWTKTSRHTFASRLNLKINGLAMHFG